MTSSKTCPLPPARSPMTSRHVSHVPPACPREKCQLSQKQQEAAKSNKKQQEATRSSKRQQETTRTNKKHQEAARSKKKQQEALRSNKKQQEACWCSPDRFGRCFASLVPSSMEIEADTDRSAHGRCIVRHDQH